MDFKEFIANIKKVKGKRNHKIKNSYTSYDYYYYYKKYMYKDKPINIDRATFIALIKRVNELIGEALVSGRSITLPYRMGLLEVLKIGKKIRFRDGKIVTNLAIDWNKTLQLWHTDEDAKTKKTLVKFDNEYTFYLSYNRGKSKYINQFFYNMTFSRPLHIKLKENIINNKVEAFDYGG